MGLFRRKIKNPVVGTARIVQCSQPGNPRAVRARCTMFVVVEGPGLVPANHELSRQIRVARWPHPGMTLPCRIDQQRPERFEIDFDAIPDWQDQARSQAAAQAAALSGSAAPRSTRSPAVTVIGAASPEQAAAGVRRAEQALGVDLDGDGRVG